MHICIRKYSREIHIYIDVMYICIHIYIFTRNRVLKSCTYVYINIHANFFDVSRIDVYVSLHDINMHKLHIYVKYIHIYIYIDVM